MTRKRDILSHFTRDELLSALDALGLEVSDRRAKDPAIEALARSKRASLHAILEGFKRDRLKELCRALGLDDSGKEKDAIIARLEGGGAYAPAPAQAELTFVSDAAAPAYAPRRGRPPRDPSATPRATAKTASTKARSAEEVARQVHEAQLAGSPKSKRPPPTWARC